jgi:DNA repair exonuclease SbcCD ATPase subunit
MTIIGHASGCQCEGCEASDLRAELAEWQQKAGGYNACNILLERAVAAKDAEIDRLRAELADARQDHSDALSVLHRTEDELIATASDLKATRAELAELESLRPSVAEIERDEAIARAEQAEAQLADAKAALTKYGDHGAFQALRDGADRAEQAEKRVAELEALGKRMSLAADSNGLGWMPLFDEARATFQGIAELNNELSAAEAQLAEAHTELALWRKHSPHAELKRAKAERDAMREALELVRPHIHTLNWNSEGEYEWLEEQVNAALAPSPAGDKT